MEDYITARVRYYYWEKDVNCATTMLSTLAEIYQVKLEEQLLAAAAGMHGAGGYGAQCGLVEGALMFIGIMSAKKGLTKADAAKRCKNLANAFTAKFGSLRCCELRAGGFQQSDPPHLCEELTGKAISFVVRQFAAEWKIPQC